MLAGGRTSSFTGAENQRPMSIAATSLHRGENNTSALERRMTETVNFSRLGAAQDPINFGLNGAAPAGDGAGLRGPLD